MPHRPNREELLELIEAMEAAGRDATILRSESAAKAILVPRVRMTSGMKQGMLAGDAGLLA